MSGELLQLRNILKERKPEFIKQDYQRRKRLGKRLKWRKPKGVHSKIRHHFKGRRKMPSPGYKSPSSVSGLHSSGLRIIRIFSMADMEKIKKDAQGVIISKNVGLKNRLQMLKKAKESGIQILNLNVDEHIKKIEDSIYSKKKKITKEEKSQKKDMKEDASLQKSPLTDKEKKEAEKKEKDKLLTKKV